MFCQKEKKIGHSTKIGATIAAKKLSKVIMNIYFCTKCKHYHIGKSNNPYRNVKRIEELLENHAKKLSN